MARKHKKKTKAQRRAISMRNLAKAHRSLGSGGTHRRGGTVRGRTHRSSNSSVAQTYARAKAEYKRAGVAVFKQNHQGRSISQMPKSRKRKKSRARRSR